MVVVVRLGAFSKTLLYQMVKSWRTKKYTDALLVGWAIQKRRILDKKIPALRLGSRDAWGGVLGLNAEIGAVKTRLGSQVHRLIL